MRRVLFAGIFVVAMGAAGFAQGGYKAAKFKGAIDPRGERGPLTFNYEKLSPGRRLVADATIKNLTVECVAPDSEDRVAGELRVFHQPSPAWVVNRSKKIGGRRDFDRVWRGKRLPIDAPSGATRFEAKRARFAGEFRKGFRRASGTFEIHWKEVDAESGDELFDCGTEVPWAARAIKRKR